MKLSLHAKKRANARGIDEQTIEATIQYGKSMSGGGGRHIYILRPTDARKARSNEFPHLPIYEKRPVAVVYHHKVVTVMWADDSDYQSIREATI